MLRKIKFLFVLLVVSCVGPFKHEPRDISLEELELQLAVQPPRDGLGLVEVQYDPCEMGIQSLRGCQPEVFSLLAFRMRCRDSVGTVESVGDLSSLPSKRLRWELNRVSGYAEMDEEGFGVIRMRSLHSVRNSKIKIYSRNNFLYMTLNEIDQIVVPKDWCQ